MKYLNKRKYVGFTSIVTSGVLVFSGFGYTIVKKGKNIFFNKDSVSNSSDYSIVPDFKTLVFEGDNPSTFVGEHEYMNNFFKGSSESGGHENVQSYDNSSSDGNYKYMRTINLGGNIGVVEGKIICISDFSGMSSNYLVLEKSSNDGFNVVTHYMSDGNNNYIPRILCICAKDIGIINDIPVIYFRSDHDVCDILNMNDISCESNELYKYYSNNLCDYPVNIDDFGNTFIAYNGIEIDKQYMKTK